MPTKDSGKPVSRRHPAAGEGPDTGAQPSHGRTRKASSQRKAAQTASQAPRRRGPRAPSAPSAPTAVPIPPGPAGTAPVPLEPIAQELHTKAPDTFAEPSAPAEELEPAAEPIAAEPVVAVQQPGAPQARLEESPPAEEAEVEAAQVGAFEELEPDLGAPEPEHDELPDDTEGDEPPRRRERRGAGTNALGVFIERQFANPTSPAHSYSDLERHSHISREALSRYVTARADRRRSPTIDTLVAIADALHVSLEAVARAAAASVKGIIPPPEDVQHTREETLGALVAALSDEQFSAVVELLRQMRPPVAE